MLDAKDCQLLSCRALAFIHMKQYEAARLDGEFLIQIRPEAPQGLKELYGKADSHNGNCTLTCAVSQLIFMFEDHLQQLISGIEELLLKIGYLLCDAALHELCIQLVSSAVQLCQSTMSDLIRMQFHLIHANCYSAINNKDMAKTAYENCLKLAVKLRSTQEQIKCCAGLAEAHMTAGHPEDAIRYYLELLAILEHNEQEARDQYSGYERHALSISEKGSYRPQEAIGV
eukprot:g46629.t1